MKIAFQVADELGVLPLMEVSEFLSQEKIDTFSLITYLSQLYHALGRSDKAASVPEQVSTIILLVTFLRNKNAESVKNLLQEQQFDSNDTCIIR